MNCVFNFGPLGDHRKEVHEMLGVLVQILIVLLIVGVILWGMAQFPIDPTIAKLVRVVIIVIVCIWLLMVLVSFLPSGGMWFGHH
jgi:hypothetical protein